jgi:hypothetical protein
MLHPTWQRVVRQTLLAIAAASVMAMCLGLYRETRPPRHETLVVRAPLLAPPAAAPQAAAARLVAPDVSDLRVSVPRHWRLQPCGRSQRVPVGGKLVPSGTAVSATGTCRLQTWCESPLALSAGNQILCRRDGLLVWGSAGFEIPAVTAAPGGTVQTGRCATVTAVCSARGRFELPVVNASTTVVVELWPPPDGSAAVALFCGPALFRVPFGQAWTPSVPAGMDAVCALTGIVLSDGVGNALASVPRATAANQTFAMADITAFALDDELLVVTVHAPVRGTGFCIRWFFWPLAVRGARLVAVGAFSVLDRPPLGSSTCVSLSFEPTGDALTLLLRTDAVPAALGLRVGIGPAVGPVFATSAAVDNTLPLAYRLVASHALALRVPLKPAPYPVYDTAGRLRALVPPDSPRFPAILLDGWRPRCTDCTVVFADSDSEPASLCYALPGGARLVSPVTASTRPPILAHMVGQTLRTSSAPPVALVGAGDGFPLLVLPDELAANGTVSVTCGMNKYLAPTDPLPDTHCLPTAGVFSAGTISRVWINGSAELGASITFSDCDLLLFPTEFGYQIAPEPCVPTAPGTEILYENVEICASEDPPTGLSAASAEVTRQLNLRFPLYAVVSD